MFAVLPAEGSSNPFWSHPDEAEGRLKRLLAIVNEQPDKNRIALFVGKSNNDNFVCYVWNPSRGEIEPMWINTENVVRPSRTALNMAESVVYGVDLNVTATGEWLLTMRVEALRSRPFNLSLTDDDVPVVTGAINGRICVIESAYAQMKKGLIPDVEWVKINGRAIDDNSSQEETIRS